MDRILTRTDTAMTLVDQGGYSIVRCAPGITQRRLRARLIRRQDPQHLGDFFERKMDLEIEREFQRGQRRKRRVTMMS
jgi:hypothetical protein